MSIRWRIPPALCVVFCSLLTSPAAAQDKLSQNRLDPRFADTPMITDPFDFSLGGFLVDLKTTAAIGGTGGLGSVIRFEEILGLDESQKLLRLGFRWDFARQHSSSVILWPGLASLR